MRKIVIFLVLMITFMFFLTGCNNNLNNNKNNLILPDESFETTTEASETNKDNITSVKTGDIANDFKVNISQNKKFPSVGDEVVLWIDIEHIPQTNELKSIDEKEINYSLIAYKEKEKLTYFEDNLTSNKTTNLVFKFIPETSGTYIFEVYAFGVKLKEKKIIILKNKYKEYVGVSYDLPDINCTDYDGKNFFKQTSCFDKYNPNGISDYCMDSTWVVDYGCSSDGTDKCIIRKYECPYGCLHGACLRDD